MSENENLKQEQKESEKDNLKESSSKLSDIRFVKFEPELQDYYDEISKDCSNDL